jgi:ADP-ribose pyrophosphatase YjhB (NUDIX family)
MLTFAADGVRFIYRTVGVTVRDGHVLLHRAEADNFWALPGGRCEAWETAAEGLAREMDEELGVAVRVERLLWVVESFFVDGTERLHALGLYLLMTLPATFPAPRAGTPIKGREGVLSLVFQWWPLDGLDRLDLRPPFLRRHLPVLPATTVHIVEWEVRG